MNRYLFRGKRSNINDPRQGEWVYGDYVGGMAIISNDPEKPYSLDCEKGHLECDGVWIVLPDTIGQCTGLTAAKSYRGDGEEERMVFEGDILWDGQLEVFGVVAWDEGTFAWMIVHDDECEYLSELVGARSMVATDTSIIGNIHDHPELLSGEA